MNDPLQLLWPGVEAMKPVFSRAAVIRWSKGTHNQLVSAGLLIPQDATNHIRCPACGQTHVAKPVAREQPDGSVRFFIPCPEHLRAEVTGRDLQQWAVNIAELVRSISSALSLGGNIKQLDSDRVWRCGRWTYQGVLRDMLFARGLRRNDATQFRRAITAARRPVVLVGSEVPDPDFWQGRIPPLIRLCEVATLIEGKLELDVKQIVGLVHDAGTETDDDRLTREKIDLVLDQKVRAAMKSQLTEEQVIHSYLANGASARKAAEQLKSEGYSIHHSTVSRIVSKHKEVIRTESSESVVRSRSSRERDTPIKKQDSSK